MKKWASRGAGSTPLRFAEYSIMVAIHLPEPGRGRMLQGPGGHDAIATTPTAAQPRVRLRPLSRHPQRGNRAFVNNGVSIISRQHPHSLLSAWQVCDGKVSRLAVLHFVRSKESYFSDFSNGLKRAGVVECMLDLHEMRFVDQANDWMNALLKQRAKASQLW